MGRAKLHREWLWISALFLLIALGARLSVTPPAIPAPTPIATPALQGETEAQLILRLQERQDIPHLWANYGTGPTDDMQHYLFLFATYKGQVRYWLARGQGQPYLGPIAWRVAATGVLSPKELKQVRSEMHDFLLFGTCYKGGWGDVDWSVQTPQGECDFDATGGADQKQRRRVLAAFPQSWIGKLMVKNGLDPKWLHSKANEDFEHL